MSEKVKEVAREEFEQARQLTRDAVRSGAYLYPIKVSFHERRLGTMGSTLRVVEAYIPPLE